MSNVITKNFENTKVNFRINNNGISEVRIDEVAKFCGWTTIVKGKEYPRMNRVNEYVKELGLPLVAKGDYIPEYIMYPLIGKANNPKATQFMLWVGQVLTQLRITSVVIMNNAEDTTINFEKKYGKYRIRKTFNNSKDIEADYKEFKELSKIECKAKRLNNIDRVKLCNIIVNVLENKIDDGKLELRASEIIAKHELINEIKTDIVKLSNKGNGGIKTGQTKTIKKLEEQLESSIIVPSDWEYVTINSHGFSNNYMYQYAEGNTYKTQAYNRWIDNFDYNSVPESDYWDDVDFTKPIELFINYVAKADMDIRNFDKSFIDMIFNRIYEIDDNIVDCIHSQRVGVCNDYEDGKIAFFIRNVSEVI